MHTSQTPGCASCDGIALHAAVAIPAHDRRRLERFVRYATRPPLATDRLSNREDGRLVYRLRHRWRDGTTHILYERPGVTDDRMESDGQPDIQGPDAIHSILDCLGLPSRPPPLTPAAPLAFA